jgi:isoleucyl-tRNA synthetase
VLQPLEGYQVERAGTHAVALNLELDESLVREGWAREVVHAVQNARKAAGPTYDGGSPTAEIEGRELAIGVQRA